MMTSARNLAGGTPAAAGRKKPRKPYTISRPREKWTVEEHDRFLHALLMFGRDWKTIEQFVGTKTATQIRSHAQKYFLKAHKLGLAAALPPPHPRRAAVIPQPTATSFVAPAATAGAQESVMNWPASCSAPAGAACWPNRDDSPFMNTPNIYEEEAWLADCLLQDDDTMIQLPLSPEDVRFAEVYRFVGDVFGSSASRPVETQLQRLNGMDPVIAETVLLVLSNLEDNLCA